MLVVAGFLIANHQPVLASIPALGFAIVSITSATLWSRRHKTFPFTALMTLQGLLAITFPVVWCVVQSYGTPAALAAMSWPLSTWSTLLVASAVPAMTIWLLIIE